MATGLFRHKYFKLYGPNYLINKKTKHFFWPVDAVGEKITEPGRIP